MKKKAKKKQFDSFPASSPIFLRRSQFTPFFRVGGGVGGGGEVERGADDWNCRLHPSNPFPKPLSLREIWLGTIQALLTPTSRLHPETIKRWKLGDTDLAWLRLYFILTHVGDCVSTDNQIRTIMWFILLHQKCWHDCCLQFSTWQYLVCFMYCLKNKQKCITQV